MTQACEGRSRCAFPQLGDSANMFLGHTSVLSSTTGMRVPTIHPLIYQPYLHKRLNREFLTMSMRSSGYSRFRMPATLKLLPLLEQSSLTCQLAPAGCQPVSSLVSGCTYLDASAPTVQITNLHNNNRIHVSTQQPYIRE